ncbi:MAG TPA: adenylate/guanylate cyclase domain-containing protein [Abditibacterium sp.]
MSALRHFEVVRKVPLSRAAVWQILSHTDRLNRHIGLPAVQFGDIDSDAAGFFRPAHARVAGMLLKWREYPFQWERDGRYCVVRVYDQGPIERFEGGLEIEECGAGATKVTLFSDMAGHGAAGRALVPLVARQFLNRSLLFCDQYLIPGGPLEPRSPAPSRGAVDEALLHRLLLDLKARPIEAGCAEALAQFLREAGDDEAGALRPLQWAASADLDEHQALRTCLHAVKAGLLNMRWAMMCPNCRVSKSESSSLATLESQVHCDLCGVSYDLNFDRYVELKFAAHPAVRRANSNVFCVGGPFQAPHILVQKRLEPGQCATIPCFDEAQPLRLRVLQANQNVQISSHAPHHNLLVFDGQKWSANTARGPLDVKNSSDHTIYLALERVQWDDRALTAARVTALQEFRDLFSSEVLKPGQQVAVENVTLFFSDLSNSTALYESIGDASALSRVGSHFDFLTRHIARNHGAVVKTMGDAVMAVFNSPADAVRAALEIQSHFEAFKAEFAPDSQIGLKIGLHHGPALAVNSNDRLDYFGRTVNIAARVAASAREGHIVMTGQVWEFSAVQRYLIENQADLSRFETFLRGVQDKFALVRVQPNQLKYDLRSW